MRVLVTGANGLLASNLIRILQSKRKAHVVGTDIVSPKQQPDHPFAQGDLLSLGFCHELIEKHSPDLVINTVALTDVDKCEENPQTAHEINVRTAENMATAANPSVRRFVHISTDQLFQGTKSHYDEVDRPDPVNVYGETKLAAEKEVLSSHGCALVVRTNFYGWPPPGRKQTFGEWLYNGFRDQKPLSLYWDYYYTPIDIESLGEALLLASESDFSGILNIAGRQRCSKHDFGMALAKAFGFSTTNVTRTSIEDAEGKVKRQKDLSLDISKFESMFPYKLPDVETGLRRFRDEAMAKGLCEEGQEEITQTNT